LEKETEADMSGSSQTRRWFTLVVIAIIALLISSVHQRTTES
jgi:hypothetical protein